MSNEAIKEKISNLREVFKWCLMAITVTFAGTVSMVLRAVEKQDFANVFLSIGGFILANGLILLAIKLWNDMKNEIKELK